MTSRYPTEPPSYEDARLEPLRTDADIERRVSSLIGRANLRQLWILFLDDDSMQLPVLIPVEGIPIAPTEGDVERLALSARGAMDEIGADSVVLVWERYGPHELSPKDSLWLSHLTDACGEARVPLRAVLLSYRAGVRWIGPDDYATGAARRT